MNAQILYYSLVQHVLHFHLKRHEKLQNRFFYHPLPQERVRQLSLPAQLNNQHLICKKFIEIIRWINRVRYLKKQFKKIIKM